MVRALLKFFVFCAMIIMVNAIMRHFEFTIFRYWQFLPLLGFIVAMTSCLFDSLRAWRGNHGPSGVSGIPLILVCIYAFNGAPVFGSLYAGLSPVDFGIFRLFELMIWIVVFLIPTLLIPNILQLLGRKVHSGVSSN